MPNTASSISLPPRKAALIAKTALTMLYERRDKVEDLIRCFERYAEPERHAMAAPYRRRTART